MRTITKTANHITQVRNSDANQIQQVCRLLGWSYEDYCNFQFEKYLEFVDRVFIGFPDIMANQVKYSAVFRGFWNNEASFRNHTEFLPFAKYEETQSPDLISEFLYIHDPRALVMDDLFITKYNRVIDLIRKEEEC